LRRFCAVEEIEEIEEIEEVEEIEELPAKRFAG